MRGRFTTEELRDPSETHQKYERTVAHKHRRNNIIIDLKESIIDFQGDLFLFQPISHVIFHYQLFFFDFDWFLKITLFCCHTGAKVQFLSENSILMSTCQNTFSRKNAWFQRRKN